MARLRSVQSLCTNVLAIALLAGCSDPVGLSAGAVDDLFAEIIETWTHSTNPVSVRPGLAYLAAPSSARSCRYSGSSRSFVCPIRSLGDMTFATSFQLTNSNNITQSEFDPGSSDALRTTTTVSGRSLTSGTSVSTMTARDSQVLSGLQSGIHALNGTGTSVFTVTNGSTATSTTMVETTADLILGARGTQNPYPTSGSITTLVYSGTSAVAAALLATVTSTFNGTQHVQLRIETGGVTQTCTVDVKAAALVGCA
jgi:hypothetical protein